MTTTVNPVIHFFNPWFKQACHYLAYGTYGYYIEKNMRTGVYELVISTHGHEPEEETILSRYEYSTSAKAKDDIELSGAYFKIEFVEL